MNLGHGLTPSLGTLHRLSDVKTRSISAENPTGAKGQGGRAAEGVASNSARDLGLGWKVNPFAQIPAGEEFTLADIEGPGAIQHIWMTPGGHWRWLILRIYWDDQEHPSVECPVGDFFACGWQEYAQLTSPVVCVNPGSALNCYWPMPFRKRCRITLENLQEENTVVYYQIDYALGDVPEDAAYFHAQFRRVNPLPYKRVYTIVDGIKGKGHYVGTYMAWGVNNEGWWGEGEIKFYMDGDWKDGQDVAEHGGDAFPTICGTGTEDYFCGSYNFETGQVIGGRSQPGNALRKDVPHYQEFTTPYAGMPQVIRPDGLYRSQTRFGMYRWHIPDPVRFDTDLQVTIQALGWRRGKKYLPLQDDIASVAYWYQTLPTAKFPELPSRDELESI